MATSIAQYTPVFLPGEFPSLTENPGRLHSPGSQSARHYENNTVCIDMRRFCLWQHCPSESWAWRWCNNLACGDPGRPKCAGIWTFSATGVMALSLFSSSWRSEGLFGQCFSIALPIQALRGLPCLGPFSVVWRVRHIEEPTLGGVLLCSSVSQAFDGPASLFFSCCCWPVGGERLWWWIHCLHMTQQYHLASMDARLSSTGISHQNLLPNIHLICLSTVNSSPCPRIAPQSLNSSSQQLHRPGDLCPCPRNVWLWQGLSTSKSI